MNGCKKLEQQINDFVSRTPIVLHGTNMLERMQNLIDALGNPEKSLKIIHVAGTSGKTSTCYFIASLLHSAGFTTGLTVSPHIDSVRERAMLNQAPLSESEWVAEMTEFFKLVKKTGVKPSYFEFYMAFAFWLFRKRHVDYAVVETGLGGTWDGSNIVTNPDKICVITDIGYDHIEILGENLKTIATEKSGIIHQNNAVFMYAQSREVMSAIEAQTKAMHGTLHLVKNVSTNFMARNFNLAKNVVNFTTQRDHRKALTKQQISQAQKIQIPARAERINYQGKEIIMDGSHNPQKLTAFVEYLDQTYPQASRTLIATLGSNKLETLNESMQVLRSISENVILTSFQNDSLETFKRVSIPANLLEAAAKHANFKTFQYIQNPPDALKYAMSDPSKQIVITGSFYLLNHLRPHFASISDQIDGLWLRMP